MEVLLNCCQIGILPFLHDRKDPKALKRGHLDSLHHFALVSSSSHTIVQKRAKKSLKVRPRGLCSFSNASSKRFNNCMRGAQKKLPHQNQIQLTNCNFYKKMRILEDFKFLKNLKNLEKMWILEEMLIFEK